MKRFASPIIALVLGVVAGYWIGYTDAWRGDHTLGARVGMLKDRVSPDAISEQRRKNAAIIRDTIHAKSGINEIPP